MALEKGLRFGPYEILSAIGVGGMGEVYLAIDTRLNRRVAIKVLPPQWSSNSEMKVRFDREARIIAGLNHPHICTLYDVGRQDSTDYLVMEYIEGQTLANRIEKGPLPIEEAVRAAIEIAGALDKAHREGIIHRDLKPGNVMLTKSGVKLLDFGLAKQNATVGTQPVSESLLTTGTDITIAGTIAGTMQYMAPEQLEGKDVTPQTDIFAFGAVLYEMVTGKKAFASESQATLISAIMTVNPPSISSVQTIDLPGLDYAVKKSLEKDPARRWQSARDLMDHLQWAGHRAEVASPAQAAVSGRKGLGPWIPLISFIAIAMVFIWLANRYFLKAVPAEEIRFQFEADVADTSFVVSPNGHWIVYNGTAAGSGTRSLRLRSLDSTVSQPIAGTDNALSPFWSPDSKRLAFFSGTTLKTVAVSGGAPEVLCEATGADRTGTWGKNDDIIFSSGEILLHVLAAGGNAEPLTSLNISHAEIGHVFPAFLPDGRHFLYAARSQQTADRAIYIGTLGSKDTTKLLSLVSPILFSSGSLLYVDNGTLVARGFDVDGLKFNGEPVRIAGQAAPSFSVSDRNVLIYQVASPGEARTSQYSWVDANGNLIGPVGKPERYLPYWDLSPDGKQAAVSLLDGEPPAAHVWVLDLERGISSRITTGTETGAAPRWSGDGQQLAYVTQQEGNRDIFARSASGLGHSEELLNSPEPETLDD